MLRGEIHQPSGPFVCSGLADSDAPAGVSRPNSAAVTRRHRERAGWFSRRDESVILPYSPWGERRQNLSSPHDRRAPSPRTCVRCHLCRNTSLSSVAPRGLVAPSFGPLQRLAITSPFLAGMRLQKLNVPTMFTSISWTCETPPQCKTPQNVRSPGTRF